jgi:hypothetical protein
VTKSLMFYMCRRIFTSQFSSKESTYTCGPTATISSLVVFTRTWRFNVNQFYDLSTQTYLRGLHGSQKKNACFLKRNYLFGYKPIRCVFTAKYELNKYNSGQSESLNGYIMVCELICFV